MHCTAPIINVINRPRSCYNSGRLAVVLTHGKRVDARPRTCRCAGTCGVCSNLLGARLVWASFNCNPPNHPDEHGCSCRLAPPQLRPRQIAMPRATVDAPSSRDRQLRSSTKRPHEDDDNEADADADADAGASKPTPAKRRRASASSPPPSAAPESADHENLLPSDGEPLQDRGAAGDARRKRGRPPTTSKASTPRSRAQAAPALETPTRAVGAEAPTPTRQAADRSARKKSARALIEKAVRSAAGDDEADAVDVDDHLAREIYDDGGGDDDEDEDSGPGPGSAAATPSKTPRRARRPKAKSPTPPRDLPPTSSTLPTTSRGGPRRRTGRWARWRC